MSITADTITDAQIREVWALGNVIDARTLMQALNESCISRWTSDEVRDARARCAEILNARAAKERA